MAPRGVPSELNRSRPSLTVSPRGIRPVPVVAPIEKPVQRSGPLIITAPTRSTASQQIQSLIATTRERPQVSAVGSQKPRTETPPTSTQHRPRTVATPVSTQRPSSSPQEIPTALQVGSRQAKIPASTNYTNQPWTPRPPSIRRQPLKVDEL